MRNCPGCGNDWPEDRFIDKSDECFRCRVRGVGFTFAGGREIFHARTDKEGQAQTIREGKANGLDPIPAGHVTFTGGTSSSPSKIKSALLGQKAAVA